MKVGKTRVLAVNGTGVVVPQWSPTMKVGKTGNRRQWSDSCSTPAMEPDHEGREDYSSGGGGSAGVTPAMEPDHEGREDLDQGYDLLPLRPPAMEPDHEGREDISVAAFRATSAASPQWSPTMKVGKTRGRCRTGRRSVSPRNGARP